MEFDKSKVVTCLDDNLEQWIGWKGYASTNIRHIIDSCKNEYKFLELLGIRDNVDFPFITDYGDESYFYPIEPPEERQHEQPERACINCKYCYAITTWNAEPTGDYICKYDGGNVATEKNYCCSDFVCRGIEEDVKQEKEEHPKENKKEWLINEKHCTNCENCVEVNELHKFICSVYPNKGNFVNIDGPICENYELDKIFNEFESKEKVKKPTYRACKDLIELAKSANPKIDYSKVDLTTSDGKDIIGDNLIFEKIYFERLAIVSQIMAIDFSTKKIKLSYGDWTNIEYLFDDYIWWAKDGRKIEVEE